jgi:hypothetical protein
VTPARRIRSAVAGGIRQRQDRTAGTDIFG